MTIKNKGFTLIEISIVLVILGLLVGGILVGRDLITASRLRKTLSQLETYTAATMTFRTKYNGLPGDIPNAAQFGMPVASSGIAFPSVLGDGNISACNIGANVAFGCENKFFWIHLSIANLIDSTINVTTNNDNDFTEGLTPDELTRAVPAAAIGKNNVLMVDNFNTLNQNFLWIMRATAIEAASGMILAENGITPAEGFNLDTKIDDGRPRSGFVYAYGANASGYATTHSSGGRPNCVGNSPYYYQINTANENVDRCHLRFQLRF